MDEEKTLKTVLDIGKSGVEGRGRVEGRHVSGRKIHAGAKLKLLPAEEQAKIAEYGAKRSVEQTRKWLEERGVKVCHATVRLFLDWYQLQETFRQDAERVEAVLREMQETEASLTPEQMHRIGQFFFSRRAIGLQNAQLWKLTQD